MDEKIVEPAPLDKILKKPEKPVVQRIFFLNWLPHFFVNHLVTNCVVVLILVGLVASWVFFYRHFVPHSSLNVITNQMEVLSKRLNDLSLQPQGIHDQIKTLQLNLETLQQQQKNQPVLDAVGIENLHLKLTQLAEEQKFLRLFVVWDFLKKKIKSGQPYKNEWSVMKPFLHESGLELVFIEKEAETGLKKPEIQVQPTAALPHSQDWMSGLQSLVTFEKIGSESPPLASEASQYKEVEADLEKIEDYIHKKFMAGTLGSLESVKGAKE